MNQKLIKFIVVLLTLLVIVGACGMALQCIGYYKSYRSYNEALNMVGLHEKLQSRQNELADTAADAEPVFADTAESEQPTDANVIFVNYDTGRERALSESFERTEAEVEKKVDLSHISDPYARILLETDLSALIQKNSDVFGWIMIPDTTVSYPLLQGNDNSFYLTRSWDKTWNASGSIYMDYRGNKDFSDFHSIIYGHRMYSDSMFNSLGKYEDRDFFEKHPSVYVLTENTVRKYNIFSAYEADVKKGSSYRLGLTETEGQQALFDYCKYYSVIDSDITPSAENGDMLLTLSTCTVIGGKNTRWVVHSVLAEVCVAAPEIQ